MFIFFILVPALFLAAKTDLKLIAAAKGLVNSLTGNTNFTSLQTKVTAFAQLIDEFGTAVEEVKHAPAGASAKKNMLRDKLEFMFTSLADDIKEISNNDIAIYESSSLQYKQAPQKVKVVEIPKEFSVVPVTQAGTVTIKFLAQAGAVNNEVWVRKQGDTSFTMFEVLPSAGRGVKLEGLDSKVDYEFKVRSISRNGLYSMFTEIIKVAVY